jgi:hypothetical protein
MRALAKNYKHWLYIIAILMLFCALAVAVTFPYLSDMRNYLIGGGEMGEWLWHYWAIKVEAHSIHETEGLWPSLYHFIIRGRPRLGNTTDLWTLSWPLEKIFSLPLYYNLKCQLVLIFDALGAYALLKYLTRRRSLALMGGIFYAFNPFTLYLIGNSRVREAILVFIPLYLLYFIRTYKENKYSNAVLAGIFFGLTAIFYWFYLMYLIFFSGFYLVYQWLTHLKTLKFNWDLCIRWLLLFCVSWFVIYPVAVPWIQEVNSEHALYETVFFHDFPSYKQIASMQTWDKWQGLVSQGSLRQALEDSQSLEYPLTTKVRGGIPLIVTLLALLGLILQFKTSLIFAVNAALFYLLSLGPFLKINGQLYPALDPIRLPYCWLWKYIPLLSRLWHPDRAAVLFILCLIVMAGLGLNYLFSRFNLKAGQRFLGIVLILVFFLVPISNNHITPVANTEIYVPPFYKQLAKEPEGWIIELPLEPPSRVMQKSNLFYQTIHEHNIVEGWGEGSLPEFVDNGFIKYLYALNTMKTPAFKPKLNDLKKLKALGVKYIIVHQSGGLVTAERQGEALYPFIKKHIEPYLHKPYSIEVERPPFVNMPDSLFKMTVYKL